MLEKYLHGHDDSTLLDDVVFEVMAIEQKSARREAVRQLLDFFLRPDSHQFGY